MYPLYVDVHFVFCQNQLYLHITVMNNMLFTYDICNMSFYQSPYWAI